MIFIGLGSSIGHAESIFDAVAADLEQAHVQIIRRSSIYRNPPMGGVAKNLFSNAVWQIETDRTPEELLDLLQSIEDRHGRVRAKRWDDRTIDLDILLFRDIMLRTDRLTIPHPEMHRRDFVLLPLQEILPSDFFSSSHEK